MASTTEHIINSQSSLQQAIKAICEAYDQHKYITVTHQTKKRRTTTQNAAMHLFFTQLADALNDAGLDQRKLLKESVDMPWSQHSVKEFLWRPIQLAAVKKDSSARLSTQEVSYIYEILNRHLTQKLGISLPWPEVQNGE